MADKYASCEGREVVVVLSNNRVFNAVVTGIEFDLGYTLQTSCDQTVKGNFYKKGTYLSCYHGPMYPL